MAAKVKFFIRTDKNDKEANIRVRFYNGRKFDLCALINKQINPVFWNNEKGCVRQRADFINSDKFQEDLDGLHGHLINQFNNESDKTKINTDWLITAIDKHYNPNKYLQGNTTLYGYIQNFIDNSTTRVNVKSGNPVCYKMRCEYQRTFDLLKEYVNEKEKSKEIDFKDIDLEFYQKFVEYLRVNKNLATNTIGKKIQTLKIFLNAATTDNINNNNKFKSHSFATLSEETDSIYLTKPELKKFYKHNLSKHERLEKVRDMFIVGCWTGLRYSDLQSITQSHIKGDFIEIMQHKTGNSVKIPIHQTVKAILKKYKGKLPKSISNQKYNEYLKEAAKLVGLDENYRKKISTKGMKTEKDYAKHELISSHTARRTFCTNAYLDKIPTITIMAISGHKTETAFLKYIKVSKDEHAKIMLEAWQKSSKILRVAK